MLTINKSINNLTLKAVCLLFISLSLLSTAQSYFHLNCVEDFQSCNLNSNSDSSSEIKVVRIKCIEENCENSIVTDENQIWYACQSESKFSGKCERVFSSNSIVFQTAIIEMILDTVSSLSNSEEFNELKNDKTIKRFLPFETLNYGRRKRQLPFETLNYGKRSIDCDCSQVKRRLPFETLLYGKRNLPFETLNYGKRAYIPIDGYIMGKREE